MAKNNENVTSDFAAVGPDSPAVGNVSGQVPTVGSTTRPAQTRDTFGRYRQRGVTLVRGVPADEHLEWITDAVTGQRIRGRNNSMLMRGAEGPVHHIGADYSSSSRYRHPERYATEGLREFQDAINRHLGC